MNEIQNNDFDYSQLDKETADYLKDRENSMSKTLENASQSLGEDLYNAQQKLSQKGYGCFEDWYLSKGFKRNYVYECINRFSFLRNTEEQNKIETFQSLPISLQNEVSKKSADKKVNQAVFEGDVRTRKEYKELESRLKQERQAKQQAESQAEIERKERERLESENEQLANQDPERIEVVPDDYDYYKGNYESAVSMQNRYKEQLEEMREELNNKEPEVKEVIPEETKQEIAHLRKMIDQSEKAIEEKQDQIDAYKLKDISGFDEEQSEQEKRKLELEAEKSVLRFKIKVDKFMEEIAPYGYMDGEIASSSDETKKKLRQSVDQIKDLTKNIESALKGRIEIN